MAEILIGTSGWVYDSWRGKFYKDELPATEQLAFYANEFSTVEINSSYYRLPSDETYKAWAKQVPSDFIFAVKASRYLTHMKKLKDAEDPWDRILNGAVNLKSKLGPILLQFPQSWQLHYDRLSDFFEVVKCRKGKHPRLVFEFRNESWFTNDVFHLLEKHDAAWCIADSSKFKRKDLVTTDFAYYRFHGRRDVNPKYTKEELKKEAAGMQQLMRKGVDVFVYFNNDAQGYAIDNARMLKELLE